MVVGGVVEGGSEARGGRFLSDSPLTRLGLIAHSAHTHTLSLFPHTQTTQLTGCGPSAPIVPQANAVNASGADAGGAAGARSGPGAARSTSRACGDGVGGAGEGRGGVSLKRWRAFFNAACSCGRSRPSLSDSCVLRQWQHGVTADCCRSGRLAEAEGQREEEGAFLFRRRASARWRRAPASPAASARF